MRYFFAPFVVFLASCEIFDGVSGEQAVAVSRDVLSEVPSVVGAYETGGWAAAAAALGFAAWRVYRRIRRR